MKKILFYVILSYFLLCVAGNGLSKTYWKTYEVVEIANNALTLSDRDGNQLDVNKDPGDYRVG